MKKERRIFSMVVALFLVTALSASAAGYWADPLTACDNHRGLQLMLWFFQMVGFELISIEEQPIAYLVPPVGDYDWGNVAHTLVRMPQNPSLEMDYVVLYANVWHYDGMGYKVDRLTSDQFATQ